MDPTAEIRLGSESPWVLFTCPCWPGNPAPLLAISSVTAETYFLCSSRIMSSCLLSCLISRWIRFCPSKICLSSRSLTVSKASSAAKKKTQGLFTHVHVPHKLQWIILFAPLTYAHPSTFSYNFTIPASKRLWQRDYFLSKKGWTVSPKCRSKEPVGPLEKSLLCNKDDNLKFHV